MFASFALAQTECDMSCEHSALTAERSFASREGTALLQRRLGALDELI